VASTGDPRLALAFLVGMACLGLVFIVVVLPFLGHFSIVLEALTLMLEGIGEYIGNPRLVWLACGVIFLMILGCCCVTVIVAGSLVTCTTSTPAQICNLIRR
jgi:hypothetical protein